METNKSNAPTDLYSRILEVIKSAQYGIRKSVNIAMVQTYWAIGQVIVEEEQSGNQRAEYGKEVLNDISKRLTKEFGKGYTVTNLRYMRLFYQQFPIHHAVGDELSWTHYRLLIKIGDEKARLWYMSEAIKENWSTRALERQINSFYYQRLLSSKDKTPVKKEARKKTSKLTPHDVLKDPYVLEFLQLKNQSDFTEDDLESGLIDELQNFLLELGSGFSFVARQKHIDLDGDHFYIDLVFYNYKLKCFVLIDLKRGRLTHQDIGQMDTYIRIYEDKVRGADDNPTIGLILCADKNEAIAKYSVLADDKHIFASKYQLVLPKVEELEAELKKEIEHLTGDR